MTTGVERGTEKRKEVRESMHVLADVDAAPWARCASEGPLLGLVLPDVRAAGALWVVSLSLCAYGVGQGGRGLQRVEVEHLGPLSFFLNLLLSLPLRALHITTRALSLSLSLSHRPSLPAPRATEEEPGSPSKAKRERDTPQPNPPGTARAAKKRETLLRPPRPCRTQAFLLFSSTASGRQSISNALSQGVRGRERT